MINILLLIIFNIIICEPCSNDASQKEVKEVIQLIKTRLNIKSLKCTFTSEKKSLTDQKKGYEEYYHIATVDFALQGKDFFISRWIEEQKNTPLTEENISSSSKQNETTSNDKPHNEQLLNVISKTLNRDKVRKDENRLLTGGLANFYFYKGKASSRLITTNESNKIDITRWVSGTIEGKNEEKNIGASSGDPRWLIGYIGKNLTNSYESYPRRTILEALDKPGKFYYKEKNGYKILWHETKFDNPTTKDSEEISFEVWIDSNDNIVKIQEGVFFVRTYGYEKVQNYCRDCKYIDCDYPVFIYRTFEFDQFLDAGNGVRIPLYGKITRYQEHHDEKENYVSLIEQLEKNEIDQFEYGIRYSLLKMQEKDIVQIYIHPDTLIVNKPIDEEIFIAPAPTDKSEEKTPSWYKKYLNIIISFSFIIICLLATIFIDKKIIRNRILKIIFIL